MCTWVYNYHKKILIEIDEFTQNLLVINFTANDINQKNLSLNLYKKLKFKHFFIELKLKKKDRLHLNTSKNDTVIIARYSMCRISKHIARRIDATNGKTDVKRRFVSLFARRSGWKIDLESCLPVNAGRDIKCRCKVHRAVY